jgi:pSer/pThr/pTyr-binding forkhead associated (FHA) protein
VIACPNCGKENQDHYKFCLGCGSDLPRTGENRSTKTQTPPTGIPAMSQDSAVSATGPMPKMQGPAIVDVLDPQARSQAIPADTVPPAPATAPTQKKVGATSAQASKGLSPEPAPSKGTICSSCGNPVPEGFAFCGACGTPVPGAEPPSRPMPQPGAGVAAAFARLVLIQPDGTEGGHVDIPNTDVAVGREAGGFFASDPFLSPAHAVFRATGSSVIVRDAGSLNGTFVKITPNVPVEIQSQDIFRIGQELLLFEEIDRGSDAPDGTIKMGSPIEGLWGRVALIVGNGRLGNAFTVSGDGVVLGRERGDIVFPEDGYVSGIHLRLYTEKGRYYLNDLGSSNGTFLKLSSEYELVSGSFLLMGQQLFRVDI